MASFSLVKLRKYEYFNAVKANDTKLLQHFYNCNFDIGCVDGNFDDNALIVAVKAHAVASLLLLLSYNCIDINYQNKHGSTALITAIEHNYEDIVDILMSNHLTTVSSATADHTDSYSDSYSNNYNFSHCDSTIDISSVSNKHSSSHSSGHSNSHSSSHSLSHSHLELSTEIQYDKVLVEDMQTAAQSTGGANCSIKSSVLDQYQQVQLDNSVDNSADNSKLVNDYSTVDNQDNQHDHCLPTNITLTNSFLTKSTTNKVDVNLYDNFNTTPLVYAVERGNIRIVKLLLDSAAIIDKADSYGCTALMSAASRGNLEIMELLVKGNSDDTVSHGIDSDIDDDNSNGDGSVTYSATTTLGNVNTDVDSVANTITGTGAITGSGTITVADTITVSDTITCADTITGADTFTIADTNTATDTNTNVITIVNHCDINHRDNNGNTALIISAKKHHKQIILYLLSLETIEPFLVNNDNRDFLFYIRYDRRLVAEIMRLFQWKSKRSFLFFLYSCSYINSINMDQNLIQNNLLAQDNGRNNNNEDNNINRYPINANSNGNGDLKDNDNMSYYSFNSMNSALIYRNNNVSIDSEDIENTPQVATVFSNLEIIKIISYYCYSDDCDRLEHF